MYERGDVYGCLDSERDQFLVVARITGFSKNRSAFFTKTEVGTPVFLPSVCHRSAVNAADGFPEVLSADRTSSPSDSITKGTMILAICQPSEDKHFAPFAVRWCTMDEYDACERAIEEILDQQDQEVADKLALQTALKDTRRKLEEAEAAHQVKLDQKLTANPRDYGDAIKRGWKVVDGGNGRQRILERQFEGEPMPRRITRHLPSSTSMRRPAVKEGELTTA